MVIIVRERANAYRYGRYAVVSDDAAGDIVLRVSAWPDPVGTEYDLDDLRAAARRAGRAGALERALRRLGLVCACGCGCSQEAEGEDSGIPLCGECSEYTTVLGEVYCARQYDEDECPACLGEIAWVGEWGSCGCGADVWHRSDGRGRYYREEVAEEHARQRRQAEEMRAAE